MLNESYIVKLPRLKRDKSELTDRCPEHLRWLWCTWAAKLLGWKRSRPEGHVHGLSCEVYATLRGTVFPFPKIEHDNVDMQVISLPVLADTAVGGSSPILAVPYMRSREAVKRAPTIPHGGSIIDEGDINDPQWTDHSVCPRGSGDRNRAGREYVGDMYTVPSVDLLNTRDRRSRDHGTCNELPNLGNTTACIPLSSGTTSKGYSAMARSANFPAYRMSSSVHPGVAIGPAVRSGRCQTTATYVRSGEELQRPPGAWRANSSDRRHTDAQRWRLEDLRCTSEDRNIGSADRNPSAVHIGHSSDNRPGGTSVTEGAPPNTKATTQSVSGTDNVSSACKSSDLQYLRDRTL
jgi:hypothetical protein